MYNLDLILMPCFFLKITSGEWEWFQPSGHGFLIDCPAKKGIAFSLDWWNRCNLLRKISVITAFCILCQDPIAKCDLPQNVIRYSSTWANASLEHWPSMQLGTSQVGSPKQPGTNEATLHMIQPFSCRYTLVGRAPKSSICKWCWLRWNLSWNNPGRRCHWWHRGREWRVVSWIWKSIVDFGNHLSLTTKSFRSRIV